MPSGGVDTLHYFLQPCWVCLAGIPEFERPLSHYLLSCCSRVVYNSIIQSVLHISDDSVNLVL